MEQECQLSSYLCEIRNESLVSEKRKVVGALNERHVWPINEMNCAILRQMCFVDDLDKTNDIINNDFLTF